MGWKMETAPAGMKRGACVNCQDSSTIDEELTSICVNGTSLCYCSRCASLPKFNKYKQGA